MNKYFIAFGYAILTIAIFIGDFGVSILGLAIVTHGVGDNGKTKK